MRMPVLNGMGTIELKLRPSGFENSADSKVIVRPRPCPKKSPTGALTAGVFAPSQYMSIRRPRSIRGLRSGKVIQMRRTVPLVFDASASTRLWPALIATVGAPLRPPLARAAAPFAPVGFSPLAHRDSTPWGISNSDCAPAGRAAYDSATTTSVATVGLRPGRMPALRSISLLLTARDNMLLAAPRHGMQPGLEAGARETAGDRPPQAPDSPGKMHQPDLRSHPD